MLKSFKNYFILIGLVIGVGAVASNYKREDAIIIKNDASIGSNTTPNSKSILDLVSTTKGFLPPRMTNTQRNNISSPPAGLIIHNSSDGYLDHYNGSAWLNTLSIANRSVAVGYLKSISGVISTSSISVGELGLGVLGISNGGTNNGSLSVTGGTVYYGDGSKITGLANGNSGQILQSNGSTNAPSWVDNAAATGYDSSQAIVNLGLSTSVTSSTLTVSLKQKDGSSDPGAGADAVSAAFLTSSNGAASFSRIDVTSALSLTIPTNATLNHASAVNQYIYVYLINNSGSGELAVSKYPIDEGSVITTAAISGTSREGSAVYSTSSRSNVPVRLIARLKSNQTSAGWWTSAPNEVSLLPFDNNHNKQVRSYITCSPPNGHGSSSTAIRRYIGCIQEGSAWTYADSSTLGGTFTANEDGLYQAQMCDTRGGAGFAVGGSLNSNQLATTILSITESHRIWFDVGPSSLQRCSTSIPFFVRAGDVFRFHTDGTPNASAAPYGAKIMQLSRFGN